MADSWHALAQISAGDRQRDLKRRLLRLFEASRLTHLRPRDADLSCDGALKLVVRHATKPEVVLRLVAEADGTGWIHCEALEPELEIDFDAADHAFAVEVVSLILHGWGTATTERRADGRLVVTLDVRDPEGDSVWEEHYETRTGAEGTRTVTWSTSRDPRVPPPPIES